MDAPKNVRKELVKELEAQKRLLKTVNVDRLPDKGMRIKQVIEKLKQAVDSYPDEIADILPANNPVKQVSPGANIEAKNNKVGVSADEIDTHKYRSPVKCSKTPLKVPPITKQPPAFRITEPHENMAKKDESGMGAVVKHAFTSFNLCYDNRPHETEECNPPSELRTKLLPHQRQAVKWMVWREGQKPSGGILGDDMGFGKTLTMVALILIQRRKSRGDHERFPTLVVCPASLMHHWKKEFERHCVKSSINVQIYHGPNRKIVFERSVSKEDYVIVTTYDIVRVENGKAGSPLLNQKWERAVLDEGHVIRNSKNLTSQAACEINAKSRWIITGTPIHNSVDDAYSLLKFLKCAPFDDLVVWKYMIKSNKDMTSQRVNLILRSLLLRRTKGQLTPDGEPLVPLPEKMTITHKIHLSKPERDLYDKIFYKYKSHLQHYFKGASDGRPVNSSVKASDALVCLIRLRQLCCHPSLAKGELPREELDLENLFADLTLDARDGGIEGTLSVKQDVGTEMGDIGYKSTKISAFLEMLENVTKDKAVKCVVVSQWTSMLDVVAFHLKKLGLKYHMLTGKTAMTARQDIVEDINENPTGPKVMLLSLLAGGTGLNLIGASHLFVLDLPWNPAIELQAHDRIHRVGQRNNVHIHRFICRGTVEEKINNIQKQKLEVAADVLKPNSKIKRMDEMRIIFGF